MSLTFFDSAPPALPMPAPVRIIIHCPTCAERHIDEPDSRSHVSHDCASCGCVWRPADVPTIGVEALTTRGEADTWPIRHEHLKMSAPRSSIAEGTLL